MTVNALYECHIVYSSLPRFITNQKNDQLPVGLLAQLADHCTGIAEVMGSTPEQALAFFFLCFHYCFSGMSMTAKITLIVKICFITNYLAWNITCSNEGRVALLSVNERWGVRTFFLLKRKGGPTLFFFKKKNTKCEIIRSFISTVRRETMAAKLMTQVTNTQLTC